jgi:uncharacterized RDD family membrane protein YckC
VQYAGFWQRVVAHLLDVLPITLLVFGIAYNFLGFDDAWRTFRERGGVRNVEAYEEYLIERNIYRDIAFLIHVFYGALMESSSWQATVGKRALGIRVVSIEGKRLSFGAAFGRNIARWLSALPLGYGFLRMLWSPRKQTWHDVIAKALVTQRISDWRKSQIDAIDQHSLGT